MASPFSNRQSQVHGLSFDQLKILADPRRLAVLRFLMAAPGSLTSLGKLLGEHPAWVRHHLQILVQHGLVLLDHTEFSGGRTEKYYRASASVLLLQEAILPEFPGHQAALFMGSHDLALEAGLSRLLETNPASPNLLCLPVGSLDGLTYLRQGLCHVAGCHLLDIDSHEYNLPYVRRFFPDRSVTLITLAERLQGLMVAPGNPLHLTGLENIYTRSLRLANRQRGSGTRLWLDRQLSQRAVPFNTITGYATEYLTHTAVAAAIQRNEADCGVGLQAAARQAGLDFIPLFHERYDLVLLTENLSLPALQPVLNQVNSASFQQLCAGIGGYETSLSGRQSEISLSVH